MPQAESVIQAQDVSQGLTRHWLIIDNQDTGFHCFPPIGK